MLKEVILQGGYIKCPICGNDFKWSYKLELISNLELESLNKTPTAVYCTPHKYITYTATVDGRVRFLIGCEKCGANIETNAMERIDQDKYSSNKM